ncbi:MAG: MFS transporter [Erysipelotrichaceae bacterium]
MKFFNQYRGLQKEIYILFFGRVISALGTFIWPLMSFILANKFGLKMSQISILLVLGYSMSVPAIFIGGKLADKFGRKKLIVWTSYIGVLMYFICGVIPLSYITLVLFFISSFFFNMQGPAYEALIADKSTPDQRERAFSLTYLGFNLGFILGPSIGGFLFKDFLWLAFIIDGATTLIGTIFIHRYIKEGKTSYAEETLGVYEQPEESGNGWDMIKAKKSLLIYLLVASFGGLLYMQSNILLPIQLNNQFAADGAKLMGMLSSFNGLIVIVFTPLFTQWFRKIREIDKLAIGTVLFVAGMSFYGIFPWIIPMFFFGMMLFTWGEVINTLSRSAYFTVRIPASHRGRISAVFSIGSMAITGGGQILFGMVADHLTIGQSWALIGGIGAFVLFLTYFMKRYDKREFSLLYGNMVIDPEKV